MKPIERVGIEPDRFGNFAPAREEAAIEGLDSRNRKRASTNISKGEVVVACRIDHQCEAERIAGGVPTCVQELGCTRDPDKLEASKMLRDTTGNVRHHEFDIIVAEDQETAV